MTMKTETELGKHLIHLLLEDHCGNPTEISLDDEFYQAIGILTTSILSTRKVEMSEHSLLCLATSNIIAGLLNGNINQYQQQWETMDEMKTFEVMMNDVTNIVECQN